MNSNTLNLDRNLIYLFYIEDHRYILIVHLKFLLFRIRNRRRISKYRILFIFIQKKDLYRFYVIYLKIILNKDLFFRKA